MKDDIAFGAVIFASLATLCAVVTLNSWAWTNLAVAAAFDSPATAARTVSCARQSPEKLVNGDGAKGPADRPSLAQSDAQR